MAVDHNIGAQNAITIYGNPDQARNVIRNHGQLGKIKQGLPCPCNASNAGTPQIFCPLCHGTGFVYTYQRRFLVADEDSPRNTAMTEIYPYYSPVLEVTQVQVMNDPTNGGIQTATVKSFQDTTIFIENPGHFFKEYQQNRTTYFFDGWTKVVGDVLKVDATRGYMWPTKTFYNAQYQSSNPLRAESDIAQIIRIYNQNTGIEINDTDYEMVGNLIKTKIPIVQGEMVADYYYADLTQILTADLKTKNPNDVDWTRDMESGDIRMAIYPWWNISRGDIIVIAADAQYRDELFTHNQQADQLFELEIFELNDVIFDQYGKKYYREIYYTLEGRNILWLTSNMPKTGSICSCRYGFKPTFICFEDNPEPNNLENRRYPKIIYAKRWSKTNKNDIAKLMAVK